ncbi:GGDEF domain-containing protein [Papillibacter cinnamivorans]|uniref:Diguanylate cyclase n=1 Tax=Papillibacter cinnamivorans DSM 12816 TaxID=1122930 RepID=A0A1W1YP45_9FIRM|nr:GGDEF domain-containing protein [Papillibacter cinnamivorans]SMC37980.1 diguanylate cyclase [Papillibacter cinnamivorans DSM 12816]
MNETVNNSIITEIQDEYRKIDDRWLMLHYHTCIGLVAFGFFMECILSATLFAMGYIEISLARYVVKYMIAPLLANLVLLAAGILAMHSPLLQRKHKMYYISLLFVGVCFVFYSVHSIYASLYLIFTAPILLTVVYSDYLLTTVTAAVSIAAKVISELFVVWDPDKSYPFSNDVGASDFFISICVLGAFFAICMIVIRFEKEKNAASIQKEIERHKMQLKLVMDELTQVHNRTALRKAFEEMEKDKDENVYIFVMIDLDNFKRLNDTLGHDIGDQCLREFGRILKRNTAGNSMSFRFGGDEFCILFKNMPMEKVIETCKKIQNDVKASAAKKTDIPLTASVGVARYARGMPAKQLLRRTDSALYRSKTMKDTLWVSEDT